MGKRYGMTKLEDNISILVDIMRNMPKLESLERDFADLPSSDSRRDFFPRGLKSLTFLLPLLHGPEALGSGPTSFTFYAAVLSGQNGQIGLCLWRRLLDFGKNSFLRNGRTPIVPSESHSHPNG